MRKWLIFGTVALAALLGGVGQALGDSPALTLEYVVTDNGNGTFQYDFTLRLDNSDGSWQPGQGYGWFIWGDAQDMPSPMADFQMITDFPIGPWTELAASFGYHNGPTMGDVSAYWVPDQVGDSLHWSGISAAFLDQGELLFSSIVTSGGAPPIEFAVANNVTPPPG